MGKDSVKEIIGKHSNIIVKEDFEKVFNAIVETYDLKNPVDQMIANRAATNMLKLQYCEKLISKYGLFYTSTDEEGNEKITMNQLAYYQKQLEAEFRANIRMLRQINPTTEEKPENFLDFVHGGKKKKRG